MNAYTLSVGNRSTWLGADGATITLEKDPKLQGGWGRLNGLFFLNATMVKNKAK